MDCNPNKAMRNTVKVFLKTELKKRETSRVKEAKGSAPPTPVESRSSTQLATATLEGPVTEPDKDGTLAAANGLLGSQLPTAATEETKTQNPVAQEHSEQPLNEVCTALAVALTSHR